MKSVYAPKWAIQHITTGRYLSGEEGWYEHWKHASKFPSRYQAKQFLREHLIFQAIPVMVMTPSDERVVWESLTEGPAAPRSQPTGHESRPA